MMHYEIWGDTIYETEAARKKTELAALVDECNRRRHVIETQRAEIDEAKARITELEMALANAEDDFTAAKQRIAELEAAQTQAVDAVNVKDLAEIAISAYLKNEQAARENAGVMVDPMRDAVTAILRAVKPQAAQAPAVTPEWLAETWISVANRKYPSIFDAWPSIREEMKAKCITVAAAVLEQMPMAAPAPVVDVEQLRADYHTAPHTGFPDSIKHALEAQGISCK